MSNITSWDMFVLLFLEGNTCYRETNRFWIHATAVKKQQRLPGKSISWKWEFTWWCL